MGATFDTRAIAKSCPANPRGCGSCCVEVEVGVDADGTGRAEGTPEVSGEDAGVSPPPPQVGAGQPVELRECLAVVVDGRGPVAVIQSFDPRVQS